MVNENEHLSLAERATLVPQSRTRDTVEPPNSGHVGDKHFVHCSFFGGRNVRTIYRQEANSSSIVGRLSTLQLLEVLLYQPPFSVLTSGPTLNLI